MTMRRGKILFDVQEASTCLFFFHISTQLNTRDIIAVGFHVCTEMRAQHCVLCVGVWVCKLTLSPSLQDTHAHTRTSALMLHLTCLFTASWPFVVLANPRNGFTLILSYYSAPCSSIHVSRSVLLVPFSSSAFLLPCWLSSFVRSPIDWLWLSLERGQLAFTIRILHLFCVIFL